MYVKIDCGEWKTDMSSLPKSPDWLALFQAQTGQTRVLPKDAKRFLLGIGEQETEGNPDTQPLVRICTMEDLEKMLCKAGLTDSIKVK